MLTFILLEKKTSLVVSVVFHLKQYLSETQAVLINAKVYAGRKTCVYDGHIAMV